MNSNQAKIRVPVYYYSSENEPIIHFHHLMKQRKRVYVCLGENFQAHIFYERLCDLCPEKRIKLFTGEEAESTEFADNPDTFLQAHQIDALFSSPLTLANLAQKQDGLLKKITYFEAIVGFFGIPTPTDLTSFQLLQGILPPLTKYLYLITSDRRLPATSNSGYVVDNLTQTW